ncbi:MAG: iron-containing alcohol dehydrogenase [Candidatus Pacearchaeota archaeon]
MFNQYINKIPITYYGRRALDILSNFKKKKIVVIYSKSIEKSGELSKILEKLKENEVEKISPSANTKNEISLLSKKIKDCDVLVSIGGGNVIDFSKLLSVQIDNPNISITDLNNSIYLLKKTELVVIPSTPSTGSQVTPIAITHGETKEKIILINDNLIPDKVILYSPLLSSINKKQMAEFFCDIFAHCAESYLSRLTNPFVQCLSDSILKKLPQDWKEYLANPENISILDNISFDGQIGGICQGNAYTGVMHAIAHQIESVYGLGHSKILLNLIKPVLEWYNKNDDKKIYQELIKSFNKLNLEEYQENIFQNINLENLAVKILNDPSIKTSPIIFNEEKILSLIKWISIKK